MNTKITKFGQKSLKEISNQENSVLYSYTTPVVVKQGTSYFVTEKKYSITTTKHINYYLKLNKFPNTQTVAQDHINKLAKELIS